MATVVVNVLLFLNCRLLEVAQANEDPNSSAELLYGSFRGLANLKAYFDTCSRFKNFTILFLYLDSDMQQFHAV
jgi:hypothetical protein